jgi:hypothetical protein
MACLDESSLTPAKNADTRLAVTQFIQLIETEI